MIFVTVGTQLPFPRLIRAMDAFAETTAEPVHAQVGGDDSAAEHLVARDMISPEEFDELFRSARLVVAHAGIGTILSAKRYGKPLIVMPRRHALQEHRNDHQMATVAALTHVPGIHIAWQTSDLFRLLSDHALCPASSLPGPSKAALIDGLSRFIRQRERSAVLRGDLTDASRYPAPPPERPSS
ncbi:glycosyltransferase-like protein PssE [Roseivivax marinus]|jgi:UDP-N-acetylglucosamine transferase subunit ALG13|uniref:Glycosyltransferase-like protein PssE n=1 Tax=Roseivivax marinus TaxID=1379903 RepID=W4HMJ5_9RHOB|nr:glycosyltransferase [Roseivivax marinus]ETW13215.1 glycosyltransferase-like protein PssE [Roseivivax marinus]